MFLAAVFFGFAALQPGPHGLEWGMSDEEVRNHPEFDMYWSKEDKYRLIRKDCDDTRCAENFVIEFGGSGLYKVTWIANCSVDGGCRDIYQKRVAALKSQFGEPPFQAHFSLGMSLGARVFGAKLLDRSEMPGHYWHRDSIETTIAAIEIGDSSDAVTAIIEISEHSGPSTADILDGMIGFVRELSETPAEIEQ